LVRTLAIQAWIAVNLTADLQDSFTWNTRQIYLWLTAEYRTEKNQLNQAVFWNWIVESKVAAELLGKLYMRDELACITTQATAWRWWCRKMQSSAYRGSLILIPLAYRNIQ